MKKSFILVFYFFFISCSSTKISFLSLEKKKPNSDHKVLPISDFVDRVNVQKSSALLNSNNRTTSNLSHKHELSVYKNESVQKWVDYFTKKDRIRFSRFLNRGAYYKEVISTILEEEELPYLLYYLPLIESGFNYKAYSHAGAVGPWQFIRGTAKRYGLYINSVIDERRDPILSTEAATKYLTDLFNIFNSWELALAAYNCGEMRVLRAIVKGKTRNFWELSRKKLLPRETRNYVPKFLAAAYIGENLSKYNFKITNNERFPDVHSLDLPGGVSLKTISKYSGISLNSLRRMNLGLKKSRIPINVDKYPVWLPAGQVSNLSSTLFKDVIKYRAQKTKYTSTYQVAKGDTLSRISKKLKVSIKRLKRLNNLKNSKIYIGQKLYFKSRSYKNIYGRKFYFVKKNDSLGKIARNYGLSLSYLKKLNGIHSNRIYIGQKIDITKGIKRFRYRVKKGDNLHLIARLYGTSINTIRKRNNLRTSRIFSGQILKI